jgi:ATP-dependent helicase YprA (DUF1998 family)
VGEGVAGNPQAHVGSLLGVPAASVFCVDRDSAPMGPRFFAFWNPPLQTEYRSERRR